MRGNQSGEQDYSQRLGTIYRYIIDEEGDFVANFMKNYTLIFRSYVL